MEAVGFRQKSTIAHQCRVFKLYLIGKQNSPQAQFHVLLQDELVGLEQHVGQQLCGQSKLGLFGWVLVCDCFVWHHEEGSYYWRSIYWTARVYGISTTHWQSGRLARKMPLVLIWRFESYLECCKLHRFRWCLCDALCVWRTQSSWMSKSPNVLFFPAFFDCYFSGKLCIIFFHRHWTEQIDISSTWTVLECLASGGEGLQCITMAYSHIGSQWKTIANDWNMGYLHLFAISMPDNRSKTVHIYINVSQ